MGDKVIGNAEGHSEQFGVRLAALRLLSGLSLEDVAASSGLTKSYLSKLERGLSQPSIATVLKLAKTFGISSGKLLGDVPEPDEISVVRKHERLPFSRSEGREGYAYEAIAPQHADKSMTPFIMRPPTTTDEGMELVTHAGEEFIFVISGEMEVVFPNRKHTLGAGDSVYFAASIPHRARSVGKVPAEALVVVSVPVAGRLAREQNGRRTARQTSRVRKPAGST
jgi:transcriptional regulator with XRE-family HTH domain